MDDITRFLKEDLKEIGDLTSNLLFTNDERTFADLICKDTCVLAGLAESQDVFNHTGAQLTMVHHDGDLLTPQTCIATIEGDVKSILAGERLALNIIGRMSGIATATHELVQLTKPCNPTLRIAGTRKTTPGFRAYEKKAIRIGGGEPHRMGLYDEVMIKDNHIKLAGGISAAIKKVKLNAPPDTPIEIEVEDLNDAETAARLGVNVIMLDNMTPELAQASAIAIRALDPKILIEISGGVTHDTILSYAPFADRISLGVLTHTVTNKDFSLELLCGNGENI